MKNLLLTSILGLSLTGCVVSGHPSTDRNHSATDNSATRYDDYQRHYDQYDPTEYHAQYRNPDNYSHQNVDQDDNHKHYYNDSDYDDDYDHWERNRTHDNY